MATAASRIERRMMHGNSTVNTRSSVGKTLYQDLYDLLQDYTDMRVAVARLSAIVNRAEKHEP